MEFVQEARRLLRDDDAPEATNGRWTSSERWGARIIQAYFKRHHRPSGGAIVIEFQKLAKRRIQAAQLAPPDPYWLICVRGPLPHAFTYLQRLGDGLTSVLSTLNNEMRLTSNKGIGKLLTKSSEIRWVSNLLPDFQSATPTN